MIKKSKVKPQRQERVSGRERTIVYKYRAEWNIYDITGEVSSGSKPFETKELAEQYTSELRDRTPKNLNLIMVIRELSSGEIIGRYKKMKGRKNFRRK